MLSRLARLRAKKGFTFIELIVVIAVMGVLLSIAVANYTYDQKPALAKSISREIYYRGCSVMVDSKAANLPLPAEGTDPYTCFFADIDAQGNIDKAGVFYITNTGNIDNTGSGESAGKEEVYYQRTRQEDGSYTETKTITSGVRQKMFDMFKNYVTNESITSMAGEYIVVVDQRYRVTAAYWMSSDTGRDEISFVHDSELESGDYCSSYPGNLCVQGQRMFAFDDIRGSASDSNT